MAQRLNYIVKTLRPWKSKQIVVDHMASGSIF